MVEVLRLYHCPVQSCTCRSLMVQTDQLEAVVKEYYIIKPVLKHDRHYAPLIHTRDSVILREGIDEVCERVYGEKR